MLWNISHNIEVLFCRPNPSQLFQIPKFSDFQTKKTQREGNWQSHVIRFPYLVMELMEVTVYLSILLSLKHMIQICQIYQIDLAFTCVLSPFAACFEHSFTVRLMICQQFLRMFQGAHGRMRWMIVDSRQNCFFFRENSLNVEPDNEAPDQDGCD
jgi:hypothetical protein